MQTAKQQTNWAFNCLLVRLCQARAIVHAAWKIKGLDWVWGMLRHTCRVGGRTRPLTSAAFRRSAMASSLLSLANSHLADCGSTLTGRQRADRERRKGGRWEEEVRDEEKPQWTEYSDANWIFFPPPYVENEQEARCWYCQLQLSPVPYQVCYAR